MPNDGYFSIKRDNEIIAAGDFFCQACVVGKPLDDQSPDPRYCISCYEVLLKEAELLDPHHRPKWIPKQPRIDKKQPVGVAGVTRNGVDASPVSQNDVSKIPDSVISPVLTTPIQNKGIMKHRGRPRKAGEVSRVTEWRRRKAAPVQGMLL